jgi:hypothetical protein
VGKLLFHGAAAARGIFKKEKSHTFPVDKTGCVVKFLGNPHMQATRTGSQGSQVKSG